MKKTIQALLILAVLVSFKPAKHLTSFNPAQELEGVKKWFAAWEMVSRDIYRINSLKPVEFVFFDEKFIYSTSPVSVPNGEIIDGPSLFDKKLTWRKKEHDGNITLPGKQVVPVGLMSFASPMENQNSFFVMPLLSFWETAGVKSKETGLDMLVTGVFLHEFAHTQQMQNYGKKMTAYEQTNTFKVEFSDDIVQEYFEKDSVYELKFRKEVSLFYNAAASTKANFRGLTNLGLEMHKKRQLDYFTGDLKILNEIDDFFLTMEGIGQYTMYAWLIHPKGGNIPVEAALKAARRGGKSWSQEEGLSLFLILSKLTKPDKFADLMFGNETVSIIELIKNAIAKK